MVLTNHKKQIISTCKKYDVASLAVFGSVLNERFQNTSDIDFLVIFKKQKIEGSFDRYFNMKEELERILNHQVDLVCENQITNPFFKEDIERSKQILYVA